MIFRNLLINIRDYWGAYLCILLALVFSIWITVASYRANQRAEARKKAQEKVFYMQNPEAVRLKRLEDSLYNKYLNEQ